MSNLKLNYQSERLLILKKFYALNLRRQSYGKNAEGAEITCFCN